MRVCLSGSSKNKSARATLTLATQLHKRYIDDVNGAVDCSGRDLGRTSDCVPLPVAAAPLFTCIYIGETERHAYFVTLKKGSARNVCKFKFIDTFKSFNLLT